MAKYRVITLAMTIKNNRIAEYNDIVEDSQLNSPAYDLIKQGFIQVVEESEAISESKSDSKSEVESKEVPADAKELKSNSKAKDVVEKLKK